MTPEQKNKVLYAFRRGLKVGHAAGYARLDPARLAEMIASDDELMLDIEEARAKGVLDAVEKMSETGAGAYNWLQRFVDGFEYLQDKDRLGRADADLWNDGVQIEFVDKPSGEIYDETKA